MDAGQQRHDPNHKPVGSDGIAQLVGLGLGSNHADMFHPILSVQSHSRNTPASLDFVTHRECDVIINGDRVDTRRIGKITLISHTGSVNKWRSGRLILHGFKDIEKAVAAANEKGLWGSDWIYTK